MDAKARYNALGTAYAKIIVSGAGRIIGVSGNDIWGNAIIGYAQDSNLIDANRYKTKWTFSSSGTTRQQFDDETSARNFYNAQPNAKVLIGDDGLVKARGGDTQLVQQAIGKYYTTYIGTSISQANV